MPGIDMLAPPQAPGELGRLGTYRVLEMLGAGGMGVVFKAEDVRLQRVVALKAMLPALASDPANRERFLREARAAASIDHDHVVTIHQVDEDRGVPFLAMQFLEGEPLDQRLQRDGRLLVAEAMRIGREITEGLAAAHDRGLIHRDIKPANIWLQAPRDRVKILDFGLARAARAGSDSQHLTQQGAIVGTPAYMAPEQVRGTNMDCRCDLFSLGCVLFRMCTGRLPFDGADTLAILMALATHTPPRIDRLNPEVPGPLAELVVRLLSKRPEGRPASAHAVAEALAEIEKGEVTGSPAPVEPVAVAVVEPVEVPAENILLARIAPTNDTRRRGNSPEEVERRRPVRKRGRSPRRNPVPFWIALGVAGGVIAAGTVAAVLLLPRRGDRDQRADNSATNPPTSSPRQTPPPPPPSTRPAPVTQPVRVLPAGAYPLDHLDPAVIAQPDLLVAMPELVAVLTRPGGEGWTVGISPDGRYVASGGSNHKACLWDLTRLDTSHRILPKPGSGGISFTADSRRLAYGGSGAHGWDLAAGTQFDVADRLKGSPPVRFASDGTTLATSSAETILLLDTSVSPARQMHSWKGHTKTVRGVAFNRAGTILASCSEDKSVCLWDLQGEFPRLRSRIPNDAQCLSVDMTPDGTTLAFGDQAGLVHVYNVRGGEAVERWSQKGHRQSANCVALTADGKWVVSSEGGFSRGGPHAANLWDARTGGKINTWRLPERCAGAAFDSTGRYLALGCHDTHVYILRLKQPGGGG
jgi:serine/threonine protein kinase